LVIVKVAIVFHGAELFEVSTEPEVLTKHIEIRRLRAYSKGPHGVLQAEVVVGLREPVLEDPLSLQDVLYSGFSLVEAGGHLDELEGGLLLGHDFDFGRGRHLLCVMLIVSAVAVELGGLDEVVDGLPVGGGELLALVLYVMGLLTS
jgi:hypothetical protein